jgi:dipeptidyl aminopeptidase/acylaminoacyl peptidase
MLDPANRDLFHRWPSFLPDGRHYLYLARTQAPEENQIRLGTLGSKEWKTLLGANSNVLYSPPGYLLFMSEGNLQAQAFDAKRLETRGDPFPIAEQVEFYAPRGNGAFSVSENGILAYRTISFADTQLAWMDRSGRQLGVVGSAGAYSNPALSPDGSRIAVDRFDPQSKSTDIWLVDVARGTPTRFTFDPANDHTALWSPDGSRIAFASQRTGSANLYQKPSSGAGSDEVQLPPGYGRGPCDWSPDGRLLVYQEQNPKTDFDLMMMPVAGERRPSPVVQTKFAELAARFSPDGRWIAYVSNESGRFQVYVQGFPDPVGKWQVSTGGGTRPNWRRDGRELFFVSPDDKLMAADIGPGSPPQLGTPHPLFPLKPFRAFGETRSNYDVARDGRRFLVNVPAAEETTPPIHVVLDWTAALGGARR